MKKPFLLLGCAAALTMASCSQETPTETTMTTPTESTMPADNTAMNSDAMYRDRADRISSRMASDMNITDTATVGKIRNVYYNRSRRYGDLQNQYASDTAGMNSAMRDVDTETDTQMKSVFTEPSQYQTYQGNRSTYSESNYMDNSGTMSSDQGMTNNSSMSNNSSMNGMGSTAEIDKMKIKTESGGKMKIQGDGDLKVKDPQDNKLKVDADDGTVKMKPEDGDKKVIK